MAIRLGEGVLPFTTRSAGFAFCRKAVYVYASVEDTLGEGTTVNWRHLFFSYSAYFTYISIEGASSLKP